MEIMFSSIFVGMFIFMIKTFAILNCLIILWGHSTTTWTVFVPRAWTKTDIFDPLPPHLVHVVIEWPLSLTYVNGLSSKKLPTTYSTTSIPLSWLFLQFCSIQIFIGETICHFSLVLVNSYKQASNHMIVRT